MNFFGTLDLDENSKDTVCALRVAGLGDEPLASADEGVHGLTLGWGSPRSRCNAHERVAQRREALQREAAAARGCVDYVDSDERSRAFALGARPTAARADEGVLCCWLAIKLQCPARSPVPRMCTCV